MVSGCAKRRTGCDGGMPKAIYCCGAHSKHNKSDSGQKVFDREQDRYLLMILGREPVRSLSPTSTRRVHGCLVHIDIIDGKIWIQRDGTEEGVATQLVRAGVPKDQIVLGFRSPELRKDSEFAVS